MSTATAMADFRRCITADMYKLKRTPVLWLALIGGAFVAVFVFLVYYNLADEFQGADENPWTNYIQIGFTMISMLLITPYAILVTAAMVYPEHQSDTWKYLFTLPLGGGNFYFAKLLITLALIALTYLVFFVTLLGSGYLLSGLLPQIGFQNYSPEAGRLFTVVVRSFLSLLGLTALQFWLSMRWKNMIVPVGVGLLGFIIGFVTATKTKLALYFPYAYPVYESLLLAGEIPEGSGLFYWGGLVQTEWFSLIYFGVFSALGYWEVRNRKQQ